jgi:hypothetical protein
VVALSITLSLRPLRSLLFNLLSQRDASTKLLLI